MIHTCQSIDDFNTLLQHSYQKPVFLLKHSTACGISAGAYRKFEKFSNDNSAAEFWMISVIQQRQLSRQISETSGVRHESPQLLLFRDARVIWHQSHWRIEEQGMAAALKDAVPR